tara:strand:+ start:40 stop:1029 length:990 start_codon:yes stop_codon:yes gene_type:complete
MADLSGLDMIREIIGQINNWQKLVKIGNEVYKLDVKDGKYKNKKGKAWTRPQLIDYIKGQKYKAPKVSKEKPKTKLQVKTTPKAKTNPLKVGKEKLNTFTQNRMNERWLDNSKTQNKTNKLKVGSDGMTRGSRATVNNMMPGRQGGGIATIIAGSLLGEGGLDPGGHLGNWIGNRLLPGPDRTLQENNALRAQLLAEKEINKQNKQLMIKATQGIKNPQQTGGVIGRRNEQYLNRPTPTPTPKKEKPKEEVKVNKKKSTVGKVMGDYAGSYNETKTKKKDKKKKNDPLKIHGKNPSAIQKKLLKAGFTTKELETLVTNYNKKYRDKRGW